MAISDETSARPRRDDQRGSSFAPVLPGEVAAARHTPLRGHSVPADLAVCHELACELSRTATWRLDLRTDELTGTRNLADVVGGPPGEVDAALRRLLAPVTACTGRWDEYQMEHRITHDDGTERHLTVRAEPLAGFEDAPAPSVLVGAVVDITESRRAQAGLAELVDRYRLLVEASPDLILVHQDGLIRYANPAAVAQSGRSLDELLGRSIVEFLDQADVPATYERLAQLTKIGDRSPATVVHVVGPDGPVRLEAISVRTVWDGRPAFQVLLRDVSAQEEADVARRARADLIAAVGDAVVSLDTERRIQTWNPAAERLYGWTADEVRGRSVHEALGVTPERAAMLVAQLEEHGHFASETVHRHRDGTPIEVYSSLGAIRDSDGKVVSVVAVLSDLSDRRAAEAAAAAEARFSTVANALDEGVLVIGPDSVIQSANPAACRLLGLELDDLVGVSLTDENLSGLDESGAPVAFTHEIDRIQQADTGTLAQRVIGTVGENPRWLSIRWSLLPHEPGQRGTIVTTFTDITEERTRTAAAEWAATHEELTGLPNGAALRAALDEARSTGPVAVVHIGLDRFKEVNRLLSHDAGDAVLVAEAERLRTAVQPGDCVGRLLGDEFVVIHHCPPRPGEGGGGRRGSGPAGEATAEAARLLAVLAEPLTVEVQGAAVRVELTASAGVVVVDEERAPGAALLLERSDMALGRAKARGRGQVQLYDDDLGDEARRRFQLREDLRLALEADEVDVHYQPIWRTGADAAGCVVVGFEALVRWQHPVQGRMDPASFVALAEETGLAGVLGRYVLGRACTQAAAWRRLGRDVFVAVNLSRRQLADADLAEDVAHALARTGLDAGSLWLDIAESSVAEGASPPEALARLRALGVRLAIDDFGTGPSSLARLCRDGMDAVKVDRTLVADMTATSAPDGTGDGGALVESVVTLAHRLGLTVVAEGVETDEQLARLADLGVDCVQGWLLGRAVAASEAPQPAPVPSPDGPSTGATS